MTRKRSNGIPAAAWFSQQSFGGRLGQAIVPQVKQPEVAMVTREIWDAQKRKWVEVRFPYQREVAK